VRAWYEVFSYFIFNQQSIRRKADSRRGITSMFKCAYATNDKKS